MSMLTPKLSIYLNQNSIRDYPNIIFLETFPLSVVQKYVILHFGNIVYMYLYLQLNI